MSFKELPKDKVWKYAKTELEKRFLLKSKPDWVQEKAYKTIRDKYLFQTNIRVRASNDGKTSVYKLSKKLPISPKTLDKQWISTIYLSQKEYELFMTLPGDLLEKKRYYHQYDQDLLIGLDKIVINMEVVWMAEIEFETKTAFDEFIYPLAYDKEVTNDQAYAGNTLAKLWSKSKK